MLTLSDSAHCADASDRRAVLSRALNPAGKKQAAETVFVLIVHSVYSLCLANTTLTILWLLFVIFRLKGQAKLLFRTKRPRRELA